MNATENTTDAKMYKAISTALAATETANWYRASIHWQLARMYAAKSETITNRTELTGELNERAATAYRLYIA